jgi:hypothetical protein
MKQGSETSVVALVVMVLITLLNASLALGITGAVDSPFAAAFDSRHIYPLAGVELALILLAYVITRHFQLRVATCSQVAS